jgi:DNA polymerase III subunit epsilon
MVSIHRALADAEMTAHLWIRMIEDIRNDYGLQSVPFGLMQKLSKVSKKKVPEFMQKMKLKE